MTYGGLSISTLGLNLEIITEHSKEGRLDLTCVASLPPVQGDQVCTCVVSLYICVASLPQTCNNFLKLKNSFFAPIIILDGDEQISGGSCISSDILPALLRSADSL